MNILVTGATGLLGYDVCRCLQSRGHMVTGVSADDFDIADESAVLSCVRRIHPDAIVHCAAYTAVDRAETDAENCLRVNETGSANIAKAAADVDAVLLAISTDYVFPGTGNSPWKPEDAPAPLNVYGLSKLCGEEAVRKYARKHFILRISWLFGLNGSNFVATMLRLGRERGHVRVVDDQHGSPTYAPDLARVIADLLLTDRYGIYHATNEGECTFADLAETALRLAGLPCTVERIPTSAYSTPAVRPKNSRLDKSCLNEAGILRMPHWTDALRRYLDDVSG